MSFRIACVGGGPGGLFFSTLIKRQMPEAEVVLYERNRAEDAFGFGVVFSDATLSAINAADPILLDGLRDHGKHWDTIEVWLKNEKRSFGGNGMAAIHRRTLLPLLQERAAEAGVDLRFAQNIDNPETLREEFDLVVGADGANSRTRESLVENLGHSREVATAKFIWFGTTHKFDGLTFVHRKSEFGNFAAHAYPISDEISTFIVETDEETWKRAGLDEFDVTQPPGISDEKSRLFMEKLFAEDLGGETIVANNSRWANFQTRRTQKWYHENVVLLGDAVHTAHFSVGSGTKMAMEDAIVLAREVAAQPEDLPTAFANYLAERAPKVDKIQNSAAGGLSWWEHFGRYFDAFDPTQFAFHFFSRSIDIDKMSQRDPSLVEESRKAWKEAHGSEALKTSVTFGDTTFATRTLQINSRSNGAVELADPAGNSLSVDGAAVVVAPESAAEIPGIAATVQADAAVAVISGGSHLNRILLSEELRLGRNIPTVIAGDHSEAIAETLVLSGRADAVAPSIHGA